MVTVKVGQRGVITLPKKLRHTLGITEGGVVEVEEKDGAVVMHPRSRFDRELADALRRGMHDIKTGNYVEFSSIPEFHSKVKAWRRSRAK